MRSKVLQRRSMKKERSSTLEENVEVIKTWEQALLRKRSKAEQFSDWITSVAASGPVLVAHVLWFGLWIAVNSGVVPHAAPFDPFPFPLLTTAVSLEAIFLALFVLASQNRLSRHADKRASLDLQIDLLVEREITAVLRLLTALAAHLKVTDALTSEQLKDLAAKTDVERLTERMDEMAEPPRTPEHSSSPPQPTRDRP